MGFPLLNKFEGLVEQGLESGVLGGVPFQSMIDIYLQTFKREIWFGNHIKLTCGQWLTASNTIQRVHWFPLICNNYITVFPQDYVECNISEMSSVLMTTFLYIPQTKMIGCPWTHFKRESPCNKQFSFTCQLTKRSGYCTYQESQWKRSTTNWRSHHFTLSSQSYFNFSSIKYNPAKMDIDPSWEKRFISYIVNMPLFLNSRFGAIFAHVNIGNSLPPQRKERVPKYTRNLLSELQNQFDTLKST